MKISLKKSSAESLELFMEVNETEPDSILAAVAENFSLFTGLSYWIGEQAEISGNVYRGIINSPLVYDNVIIVSWEV